MIIYHTEELLDAAGKTWTDLRRDKVVSGEVIKALKSGSGNFRINTILKICDYLGCSLDDIMEIRREYPGR